MSEDEVYSINKLKYLKTVSKSEYKKKLRE